MRFSVAKLSQMRWDELADQSGAPVVGASWFEGFLEYTSFFVTTYYRLPSQGLEYEIQNRRVISITDGPTQRDKRSCVKGMFPK